MSKGSLFLEGGVADVIGSVEPSGQLVQVAIRKHRSQLDDETQPTRNKHDFLTIDNSVGDDLADLGYLEHWQNLVEAGLETCEHSGVDGIWAYEAASERGVSLSCKFSSQAVEKAIDCVLASHIACELVAAQERSNRCNSDDMTLQSIAQAKSKEDRCEVIYSHSLDVISVGLFVPVFGYHDARVVDEHVDHGSTGSDFLQHIVHAIFAAQVALIASHHAAQSLKLCLDFLELVRHDIEDDELALMALGKKPGRLPTNAIAGSGNHHQRVLIQLQKGSSGVQLVHQVDDDGN